LLKALGRGVTALRHCFPIMFKKKPNVRFSFLVDIIAKSPKIKPLAPLRSSDRRKTADQIITAFGIDVPAHPEQGSSNEQAAPALTLGTLRNSLLPENALSARFTTTAGPELKQISGTVYVGAHSGEEQRVLWFKVEEKLIPTGL